MESNLHFSLRNTAARWLTAKWVGHGSNALMTRLSTPVLTVRPWIEIHVTPELSKGSAEQPNVAQPAFFAQKHGCLVSHRRPSETSAQANS
jgi:hypothetical protein